MLKHQPKTLAKILDYIARRSPGEHGLFWDTDGAMPWKEFYWALQEDPSLRFVRESTIRELALLGIELPWKLDGNMLRLCPEVARPSYPPASDVPERLYFGLRPKNMVRTQEIGLNSSRRRFIAVCADRDLALRIAKRREQSPILIEILAREASGKGVSLSCRRAGSLSCRIRPGGIYLLSKASPGRRRKACRWRAQAGGQALPCPCARLVYR